MSCINCSAIVLKVDPEKLIFCHLRNEKYCLSVVGSSLFETINGSDYAPTRHYNPNTNHVAAIVCTSDKCVLSIDLHRQTEVGLGCEECAFKISSPS